MQPQVCDAAGEVEHCGQQGRCSATAADTLVVQDTESSFTFGSPTRNCKQDGGSALQANSSLPPNEEHSSSMEDGKPLLKLISTVTPEPDDATVPSPAPVQSTAPGTAAAPQATLSSFSAVQTLMQQVITLKQQVASRRSPASTSFHQPPPPHLTPASPNSTISPAAPTPASPPTEATAAAAAMGSTGVQGALFQPVALEPLALELHHGFGDASSPAAAPVSSSLEAARSAALQLLARSRTAGSAREAPQPTAPPHRALSLSPSLPAPAPSPLPTEAISPLALGGDAGTAAAALSLQSLRAQAMALLSPRLSTPSADSPRAPQAESSPPSMQSPSGRLPPQQQQQPASYEELKAEALRLLAGRLEGQQQQMSNVTPLPSWPGEPLAGQEQDSVARVVNLRAQAMALLLKPKQHMKGCGDDDVGDILPPDGEICWSPKHIYNGSYNLIPKPNVNGLGPATPLAIRLRQPGLPNLALML
ncbi:hypothetical protein QJQ45_001752 [Haematococcus lacustris]|nr:hypothetical protein QJQ45_001752 [Haematococcus lacustris]